MALNTSATELGVNIEDLGQQEVTIYPPVKIVIEGEKCGTLCRGLNDVTETKVWCIYFGKLIVNEMRCDDCMETASVYTN